MRYYRESIAVRVDNNKSGFIVARKCPNIECDRVVDHPKYADEKDCDYDIINDKLSEEYSSPKKKGEVTLAKANQSAEKFNDLFQDFMDENATLVHDMIEAGFKIQFTIERPDFNDR